MRIFKNFKNRSFSSGQGAVHFNQSQQGLSSVYLDRKTKRIFGIACLAKKLGFHTEICEIRDERMLIIVIFDWIKKLSKSN